MKTKQLSNLVHLVTFDNAKDLAAAFMPMQEYYENVHFADSSFSKETFDAWYAQEFGTNYWEDWVGFNIPLYMLPAFEKDEVLQGLVKASPLSFELYSFARTLTPNHYLIGVLSGDNDTLEHELAHARYYTDAGYKVAVNAVLEKHKDALFPLRHYLKDMSYNEKVLTDECHAYILMEQDILAKDGIWNEHLAAIQKELKVIYEQKTQS